MREVDVPNAWKAPIVLIGLGILVVTLLVAGSGPLTGATDSPAQGTSGTPAVVGSGNSEPTQTAEGGFRSSVLNPILTQIAQFAPTPAAVAARASVWLGVVLSKGSTSNTFPPTAAQTSDLTPVIPNATPIPNLIPSPTPMPPTDASQGDDDENDDEDHHGGDEDEHERRDGDEDEGDDDVDGEGGDD